MIENENTDPSGARAHAHRPTRTERVGVIVERMRAGKWERSTGRSLAAEWGLDAREVRRDACTASLIVRGAFDVETERVEVLDLLDDARATLARAAELAEGAAEEDAVKASTALCKCAAELRALAAERATIVGVKARTGTAAEQSAEPPAKPFWETEN